MGRLWGRFACVTAIGVACLSTGGCLHVAIGGGLTLSHLSTITAVASIAVTGKGLGEHGLDLVTGMDCRVLESLMRDEREVCEERNSPVTQEDFRGVFSWMEEQLDESPRPAKPVITPTDRQLAGGPVGKVVRFVGLDEQVAPRRAEPPAMLAALQEQPPAPRPEPETAVAGRESGPTLAERLRLTQLAAQQIIDALDDTGADVSYLDVVAPIRVAHAGTTGIDLSLRLGAMPAAAAPKPIAARTPVLASGLPHSK
jgi:hypothetical protein